jgi:ribonuclease HI
MGVVYACAFSFMSKYLYQSCGPKPMTRVDINDNNQSSNNKLEFEATNNVAEYEALVLGLRTAKDMKIEKIAVFGDVELII